MGKPTVFKFEAKLQIRFSFWVEVWFSSFLIQTCLPIPNPDPVHSRWLPLLRLLPARSLGSHPSKVNAIGVSLTHKDTPEASVTSPPSRTSKQGPEAQCRKQSAAGGVAVLFECATRDKNEMLDFHQPSPAPLVHFDQ